MRAKMTFFMVALLLIFGVSTSSQAGLVDPVSFYLLDNGDPGDKKVTIEITNFNLPTNIELQFSIGGGGFSSWDSDGTIDDKMSFTVDQKQLITFRLYDTGEDAVFDTDGNLTFSGGSGQLWGIDAYTSAFIEWGNGFNLSFITSSLCDKIGPVPIPTTALIFGTGILCLVGIRRKIKS